MKLSWIIASATLTWIAVGGYIAFILAVVVRGARRIRNMSDYATGSVQFSPVAVGLSLAAGMTSAATFIINPGFIAYYGISGFISMAVALPIGAMVSLIILSHRFRQIGVSIQARSLSAWMGLRYQHKGFAFYFALLSLLLITFIVLICVGLTQILSQALQLPQVWVLTGIIVFVFGYMMFGGANSLIYTNALQALVMLVVAIVLLASGWRYFEGGVGGFLQRLSAIDPMLAKPFHPGSPLFRDAFEVIFCQLIVGFAIVCQPHIITRSLMLRSAGEVNRYLTTAVIVQSLFFFVVFAGLYARLSYPDLQLNGAPIPVDAVMSTWVVNHFPSVVKLLLVLGMIAAGISTLEGLVQSLSTTISQDIVKPLLGNRIGNELHLNRWVIVGLAVVSGFISWHQLVSPDLSVGILAQNGVYAFFSAALVPVLFGILYKPMPLRLAWLSSLVAVVVHFGVYYGRLTPYMESGTRNPGIAAALAILASLATAGVGLLIIKNKKGRAVA